MKTKSAILQMLYDRRASRPFGFTKAYRKQQLVFAEHEKIFIEKL